jgi:hypothetical protein
MVKIILILIGLYLGYKLLSKNLDAALQSLESKDEDGIEYNCSHNLDQAILLLWFWISMSTIYVIYILYDYLIDIIHSIMKLKPIFSQILISIITFWY